MNQVFIAFNQVTTPIIQIRLLFLTLFFTVLEPFYICFNYFVSLVVVSVMNYFRPRKFYLTQILPRAELSGYTIYDPHDEKTCLNSFRPGLTQTKLYSHRRLLMARNLEM